MSIFNIVFERYFTLENIIYICQVAVRSFDRNERSSSEGKTAATTRSTMFYSLK